MRSNKGFSMTTQQLTRIGLMAALVFVSNYFFIRITLPLGVTRLHLGNACVLLSGFYLGGLPGGFAAGIGAALFDLLSPGGEYIKDAPITFAMRFLMAFTAGAISRVLRQRMKEIWANGLAALAASLLYVLMYMGKTYIGAILLGSVAETAMVLTLQKGALSLVNAAIGIGLAAPLSLLRLPGRSR